MKKIKVITTSTGCLDYYKQPHDVDTLRLKLLIGDQTFIDGETIKADEFYERMRSDRTWVPKTSQPSPAEVVEFMQKYIDQGYDEIFFCTISGELSGTVNSVRLAGQMLEDQIKVTTYDTKTVCFSEGYIALTADKLFKEGKTTEEVITVLDKMKENNSIFFAVDDLTQLIKNGRLSGAKAFIATALKIKPILQVEGSGKIVAVDKTRNIKKSLMEVTKKVNEYIDGRNYYAHLLYAGNPELKDYFLSLLKDELGIDGIYEAPATPVVGAHIGGDVVGIGVFILD